MLREPPRRPRRRPSCQVPARSMSGGISADISDIQLKIIQQYQSATQRQHMPRRVKNTTARSTHSFDQNTSSLSSSQVQNLVSYTRPEPKVETQLSRQKNCFTRGVWPKGWGWVVWRVRRGERKKETHKKHNELENCWNKIENAIACRELWGITS
jgi:hypothetical protein